MHGVQLGMWEPNTPDWYAARDGRVGGSDIGTILGVNEWDTRTRLLYEKAGRADPKSETDRMILGQELEPAVLSWGSRKHGWTYRPDSKATFTHPDHGWAMCNPDGITDTGLLVEVKTTSDRTGEKGWGRAGTDLVPLTYQAQVTWSMGVLGLDEARLLVLAGALNGRPDLHIATYKFRFDPALFARLLTAGERFIADLHQLTQETKAA